MKRPEEGFFAAFGAEELKLYYVTIFLCLRFIYVLRNPGSLVHQGIAAIHKVI